MANLAAQGTTTFRAADVFSLLPPRGLLPRAAIDPVAATQTFFPEQIDVALVPARAGEVNALLAQTEGEPAIDLTSGTPAQVLVLVPLPPSDYATLAPGLTGAVSNAPPPAFKPYPSVALPRIDPLVLRLPGRMMPPTPSAVWARIWQLAPANLPWMVRPTDGGIGGVKAADAGRWFRRARRHADTHANPDADPNSDSVAVPNADAAAPNSHGDTVGRAHANSHSDAEPDTHGHTDPDTATNACADANPNSAANAQSQPPGRRPTLHPPPPPSGSIRPFIVTAATLTPRL